MEGVRSIFLTPKHTCTLTCTNMEADDDLTAVIHQASEREISEEKQRERKAGGTAEKTALCFVMQLL